MFIVVNLQFHRKKVKKIANPQQDFTKGPIYLQWLFHKYVLGNHHFIIVRYTQENGILFGHFTNPFSVTGHFLHPPPKNIRNQKWVKVYGLKMGTDR